MVRARKRKLKYSKKGKGMNGAKWGHGFVPKNAAARKLKKKLDRNGKRRKRTAKGYPKK
ncbi:hypothetical protein KNU02_gp29 [Gordonia phage Pleakley]|uniref:Uncharacterized protein n=1 Tax=Gordonia phage Pleakley TaxID=2283246 RepID=A0A345M6E7_9CAUD|nr:hypothetical protein KNU02_gp29 [Gordonia phage Pleakley]AXH49755.1 hypothetical protein SEA_FURY_29 [Gordonia phage Fury]AXH66068.1 hypothetical protein SEA_PLEAKLEY_29 [Gordonia phage Pleakley]